MSSQIPGKYRTFVFAGVCLSLAFAILFFSTGTVEQAEASAKTARIDRTAPAATFPGTNLGAIPDGASPCHAPGVVAPRDVSFNVGGLSGAVTDVNVSMAFGGPNHSFIGDVTATLIAPNGTSHTIFGRTLATTSTAFGDSSDLGAGPYIFDDSAAAPPSGGWWQQATAAAATTAMATGTYRTTNSGGSGAVNPQPPTSINTAFAGVANANGIWTLRLTDGCNADTGAIAEASLTLETAGLADANADFDGDGKTDFTVARGTNTPLAEGLESNQRGIRKAVNSGSDERQTKDANVEPTDDALAPPIYWYVRNSSNGSNSVVQVGDAATDFITPEDFDGDGKDDIAVWTEGPSLTANFKIFQSSTNTLRVELFGQTGDDPAIVGDYDGDGKADPAVYRCPGVADPDGQCFFYYRGSLNNPGGNVTFVPWGFGVDGDFFPYVGDMDGDGKNDFMIQRANPAAPSNGQFVLLRSSDFGVEYINWGLSTDFLIPGDYDGDGKTDIMVRRTVSGNRQHWLLTRTGLQNFFVWGVTGDVSTPGDYDGDGKTDLAIWRGNTDPTQNFFWVLNSGNGTVTQFEWGQCPTVSTCDVPVAGWLVK